MSSQIYVYDVHTKRHVKLKQAKRRVAEGVWAWVEEGVSVRMLTSFEMLAARAKLPKTTDSFPWAELPGVVTRDLEGVEHELQVAYQGTLLGSPKRVEALALDLAHGLCRPMALTRGGKDGPVGGCGDRAVGSGRPVVGGFAGQRAAGRRGGREAALARSAAGEAWRGAR